jgi:hypothetical protein
MESPEVLRICIKVIRIGEKVNRSITEKRNMTRKVENWID